MHWRPRLVKVPWRWHDPSRAADRMRLVEAHGIQSCYPCLRPEFSARAVADRFLVRPATGFSGLFFSCVAASHSRQVDVIVEQGCLAPRALTT